LLQTFNFNNFRNKHKLSMHFFQFKKITIYLSSH